MKSLFAVIVLIALAGLALLSFAPAELVGIRSGLSSFAGVATALGLALVMLAGGWMWLRDTRKNND